ncbi:UTP--glucose-1-phosphate uridylyltransferase [Candidatus Falkowbacteria bacterium]|nr:UTP--glucose-1-phosphate uridylyltransferase [Candidatus Falkowbacteria bacterium]
MQKIRKAIIPVAGFGTRFLPATKAMPKEMLPIIDKPVIQYIVEEAVASGITDIILVTGPSKRAIEDHFDINTELEDWCRDSGKTDQAKEIRRIAELANFIYIRQKGPYGNGTPVLNAKDVIGDEPFAVIWGDEPFVNPDAPRLKQLIDTYEQLQSPIMTAREIDDEGTKKYGVIEGTMQSADIVKVEKVIEKPGPQGTTSRIGALGAYILTPDIFPILENTKLGKDDELWLVDAIQELGKQRPIHAKLVQVKLYDTGSKIGWLKANIDFALQRDDLKDELRKYIDEIK